MPAETDGGGVMLSDSAISSISSFINRSVILRGTLATARVSALDAFAAEVNVEPAVADEADERHVEFAGEFDGEARGRADSGHYGNAGDDRFLHKLKTGTATDEQNTPRKGHFAIEKLAADHFIERVVAADVL